MIVHDEKYYEDAKVLLGQSLKTCRKSHRGDYTRAIRFAEKKIRLLKFASMVTVFCLVIGVGGCNTMEALNNDTRAAIRAVTEK